MRWRVRDFYAVEDSYDIDHKRWASDGAKREAPDAYASLISPPQSTVPAAAMVKPSPEPAIRWQKQSRKDQAPIAYQKRGQQPARSEKTVLAPDWVLGYRNGFVLPSRN